MISAHTVSEVPSEDRSAPLALCTIVTGDFLFKAGALAASFQNAGMRAPVYVVTTEPCSFTLPNARIVPLDEVLLVSDAAKRFVERYGTRADELRWCLKPVVLSYVLQHLGCSRAMYCDSDFYFADSPTYIAECLRSAGLALTPHWRPLYPQTSAKRFRLNFQDGLFNAGCIASSHAGLPILEWWTTACSFECRRSYEDGLYDDQRYLDLVPIYFPQATIVRHMGYNLADWNIEHRNPDARGHRLVPDIWPVCLIHFTKNTIRRIEAGDDPLLKPYYEVYHRLLLEAARQISIQQDLGQ